MSTSAIPAVIDALFTAATTALSNIKVYDGYGVSEDPGDFLMVGVEDPDYDAAANSANSRQSWATIGAGSRDEEGEITCAALSWNGNADQKAARTGAFAIVAAVENLCRANPALGVSTVLWTGVGTDTELLQQQGEGGASAIVIFKIAFRARI